MMSFVDTPYRVHCKGWTAAIYDSDGSRIFTAGADGKINVLSYLGDPNPMEHVIGEKINAIAFRDETLVIATEGTCVHVIQIEDGLPEGMATRFTAEVTHIVLNKDGTKLAACSSDFCIKIVNFLSSDDREFKLEGHSAGVLSVCFDPLDIFLSSASCDGTIRIWRLDDRKEVKCIRTLSPCNDTSLALSPCRMCWESSDGTFLAVPVDKQLCLYERNTWQVLCYLSCPSITGPIIVCASSSNGQRIAAGTGDGWVVVWRLNDRHVVHRLRNPSHSGICSLVWHPQQDAILLCSDKNGFVGTTKIPPTKEGALSLGEMNDLLGCDEDGDTNELLRVAAAQAESSRLIDEDEAQKLLDLPVSDNDDAESIDLSRIKSDFMPLDDDIEEGPQAAGGQAPLTTDPATRPLAPQALQQVVSKPRTQKPFQPGSMPSSFRERFMVWNRIGVVIQYRGGSLEPQNEDEDDNENAGFIEMEFHDTTLHHSLRLANRSGYTMADLSMTALVLASPGSEDPSLADDADAGEMIEPTDLSQVAILPLDTNVSGGAGDSASSEWTVKLPAGEACRAVCLVPNDDPSERGYAIVATSKRYLRVFAQPAPNAALSRPSTGLHLFQLTKLGLPPISIPGTGVVAMCSHPCKPILGIIVSTESSELVWRLYYLGGIALGEGRTSTPVWLTGSLSTWQLLPLSPPNEFETKDTQSIRLTWFGFSDLGGLYTHDSAGVVRRLLHTRSSSRTEFHWAPVCNTRSAVKPANRRSDHYFLVGILESVEVTPSAMLENGKKESTKDSGWGQLQAIYCKASKWPRVFPRPVLSGLSFRLPLCSLGMDQADLEESYLRCMINEDWPVWGPNRDSPVEPYTNDQMELMNERSERCSVKRKGILLRLFALAAKLESDWASLAVARLMPDAATIQLAIRYAGRLRRQHLAQRLAEVALQKERELEEQNESESEPEEPDEFVRTTGKLSHRATRPAPQSPSEERWSSPTSHRRRRRQVSGNTEDQDVNNVSLVSSATDDTHDEVNLSGLPVSDSVDFSQSLSTPSATRNPFRESTASEVPSGSNPQRGRGSEILDSWQPKALVPANPKSSQPNKSKEQRNTKKRTLPTNEVTKKKRSKQSKSGANDAIKPSTVPPMEFLDWFDEHRTELEEKYPDESAEELMRIARSQFAKFCSNLALEHDDNTDMDKENRRAHSPKSEAKKLTSAKRPSKTEKTSERLSAFRFETNDSE